MIGRVIYPLDLIVPSWFFFNYSTFG